MSLHILESGSGTPLIMLHGWGLNSGVFATVAEPLAQHFRIMRVDLPGHGNSRLDHPFTLDNVSESLARELPERGVWLGWSLGGTFAMSMAARYPERVERLILVNTTPRFVKGGNWPYGMHPSFPEQFAHSLSNDYEATVGRFLALVARGSPNGTTMLKQLRDAMQDYPPPDLAALQGGLSVLSQTDMQGQLDEIRCPTLVIQGDRDMIVSADSASAMCERIDDCRLAMLPGAGHAPFLSHEPAFLDAVLDFAS